MQYAKIQGAFLRSVAFKDADMAARGAWLTLNGFCVDQENGGRIVGCRAWNDRQWLSRADCMRADVDMAVSSELALWEDDDLLVVGYNLESERSFQALSETNRARAKGGWEKRRDDGVDAAGTDSGSHRHGKTKPPAMPQASSGYAGGIKIGCLPSERVNERGILRVATPPPPSGEGSATRENIESARVQQREAAITLLQELEASGRIDRCDQALLKALQKGIAFNKPGDAPIGGPFSPTAKLRQWLSNPPSSQASA